MRSKDYVLQIKIKNAPMLNIMRAHGINTAAELHRVSGVCQGSIGNLLNLKQAPINKSGRWSEPVLKIAEYLRVTPDMLFPEQHLTKALKRNTIEGEVTFEEMGQLVSTAGINYISESIENETRNERLDKLEECLGTLAAREREILEMRFGINRYWIEKPSPEEMLSGGFKEIDLTRFPYKLVYETEDEDRPGGGKTYEQIAQKFAVTRERVRQIAQKALRKLRMPHRMNAPKQKEPPLWETAEEKEESKKKIDALLESRKDPENTWVDQRNELIKKASVQGGRWHHLVEK